jgi:hypothetical protein
MKPMPSKSSASTPKLGVNPGLLALRGSLLGALVVGLFLGLAWQFRSHLLSVADYQRITGFYYWAGAVVGLLSASLGNALIAFGSMKAQEDPANSTGFIRAVVLDFALQFACAGVSILGLIFKGLKFEQVAAFGITLSLTVVVCRMAGTAMVSRALVTRAKQRNRASEAQIDQ